MNLNFRNVAYAAVVASLATSAAAQSMVTDADGNVGYATVQDCDAAVINGTARFYRPSTRMAPKRRAGEASVSFTTLRELGAQYNIGACDQGAPDSQGRGGVSKALQGRWIPYSPSMPINAYKDRSGKIVRVTMRDCDNNFSGPFPRPVPAPKAAPVAAPVAPPPPPPPVVIAPPPPPPPAPPAPVLKMAPAISFPYVFGTLGAQRDLVGNAPIAGIAQYDDHDTKLALQAGAGYQFNKIWGLEAFAEGARRHDFENGLRSQARALGLRVTAGQDLSPATRVFGKLGVARVEHPVDTGNESQTRPTVGLGITYSLNDRLSVRGDYDHFVKKSSSGGRDWKAMNYLGVGLQYNFKP